MTAPSGAVDAQVRNAAAVARLDDTARPTIGAAIHEVLAAVLADNTGTPSVEAVASTARSTWRRAVDRVLAWVRDTFTTLAGRAADNLPDDAAPVLTPATLEQRVDDIAAQVAAALDSVPDTVASRVATTLRDGWARGESVPELNERVAAVLAQQEWGHEIERLVRTTTTTVYNAAHSAVADALEQELGTPLRRMWLATVDPRTGRPDDRTRPEHARANLQVVNSGDTFTVGGVPMRWPGDPRAPAHLTVNCRCVVVAVLDDFVIDLAHRVQGPEADVMSDLAEQADEDATADDAATTAAAGSVVLAAMPRQLMTYWSRGEGAARIRWGSGGDFTRCVRALRSYLPPGQVEGACATLHRAATGKWPGQKSDDDDTTEGDAMPCACQPPAAADDPDPEAVTAVTMDETDTMAMIALAPSPEAAAALAVDGGIPPEELHVTLLFLGDASTWQGTPEGDALMAMAEQVAADVGPITGRLWARVEINPDSDEPTAAYLVGDDTGRLGALQAAIEGAAQDWPLPPLHSPYVPHLSTRYESADLTGMDAVGSDVVLDRVRVSIGPDVVDLPLSGDTDTDTPENPEQDEVDDMPEQTPVEASTPAPEETRVTAGTAPVVDDPPPAAPAEPATSAPEGTRVTAGAAPVVDAPPAAAPAPPASPAEPVRAAVVASQIAAADDVMAVLADAVANAPAAPPREWFDPVAVEGPTPPTVNAQGRVWGHIGQAGVCHAGIADECVTIPPTRTAYGAFHREDIQTADGSTVRVGYLYTGCGHSSLDSSMDSARDYLDAECVRTAAGRVHDTEYGPLFVGALVPGVTADDVARLYKLSGEWFTAPLELHAAVGVTDAGFPVDGTGDTIRVATGDPAPIAAALSVELVAGAVVDLIEQRAAARTARAAALVAVGTSAARSIDRYRETRGV